jgi:hypothetical protein
MSERMRAYSIEREHVVGDPPERLERVAQKCSAIREDGTPCRTWSLWPRCWRHRARTSWRREDDE